MSDFRELVDLASERVGGAAIAANDDFFAPKENLVRAAKPVFREEQYTDRGKWMDGWETRRRREPGHDWCVVRLGLPGRIEGLVVDTTHFKGNAPEACSMEATADPQGEGWTEVLPKSPLRPDGENLFPVSSSRRVTHVRLNIFPDGGVARLRVHGEVLPDWERLLASLEELDLAALENGGRVVGASDQFFGSPQNLLRSAAPDGMHDGWETRRRRGPGHDWVVIRLGRAGTISRAEVDTSFFKGNAPGSCSIGVCHAGRASGMPDSAEWKELLSPARLEPDRLHRFEAELRPVGPATHARLNIYPDGGVARLRLFGPCR
jgi:allantoicase